jgi:hypothetical protein
MQFGYAGSITQPQNRGAVATGLRCGIRQALGKTIPCLLTVAGPDPVATAPRFCG